MPYKCPFCDRVNPSDAKFCNACGAPLHLLPCPHCGAVNDAEATTCHQCKAALPEGGKAAAAPLLSTAQPVRAGASASGAGNRAGPVQTLSPEAEALDGDDKVLARLRQLLAQTESGAAEQIAARDNPGPSVPESETARSNR